ncbi:MAG: PilZ domain-containing protein [Candidatus Omnitrophota bacterium]
MTERRRFLRFDTALNALCEIVSEKCRASYKVKNISSEGALVLADKKFGRGAEINISMDVPGDNVPIVAACRVAWQDNVNHTGLFQTGLNFTKIDGSDKGRLLEYTYLQWLKILDRK